MLVNAGAATAVINVVLNALPAWVAVRSLDHVPLWTWPLVDGTGVYTDTLGTCILLPFVTTLLVTTAVWRDRRRGALSRLATLPPRLGALAARPPRRFPRAFLFGGVTVALFALPAAAILAVAVPDGMGTDAFVAYKTVLGVLLGLVATPLIAIAAMADLRTGQ